MVSMKHFRLLAMATLAALAVTLAAALPGVSAEGGGDKNMEAAQGQEQAVSIPEKAELNYPNLGSRLDGLVASVEAGQAAAQDAASNSPVHSGGSVAVTIYLSGNVDEVVSFLEDNGGDPRNVGEDYIEAYVPVTLLGQLSQQPGVARVREVVAPQPAQTIQSIIGHGPAVHGSQAWNLAGYSGQGVKVGVIDTGFTGFSSLMGTELPNRVVARCFTDIGLFTQDLADCEAAPDVTDVRPPQCLDYVRRRAESGDSHGTIVAESLIDIAPGVELYIANPQSPGDLQATAAWMASQGVSVINHSVSWILDGPGDGTSPISSSPLNTVDLAVASDVTWVNAAGNGADDTWFGGYSDPDGDSALGFGDQNDEVIDIHVRECQSYTVQLRWEDTWEGASTDLDLYLYNRDTDEFVLYSVSEQSGGIGHVPFEGIQFRSSIETRDLGIAVIHHSGEAPDWVQITVWGPGDIQHYTKNGSIVNPAESANLGMLTVGAAHWNDVHAIEPYSSRGPTPDGRFKPDIVGADCGATALTPLDEYNEGFCGTSQASPHVAGMAALVRQRFSSYTPAQVASYLKDNAEQRQSPDPNYTWGYGFAQLPPPDGTAPPVPAPSNVFTRDLAADFNTLADASNLAPQGIWSDGETMWVADFLDEKIYAYEMATKARVTGKDFDTLAAENTWPVGIWSDGETLWVADFLDGKIYAYEMATKARVSDKDFDTLEAADNTSLGGITGIWSDGTTMWVADWLDQKIYAHDMATKARVSGKDFDTLKASGNGSPQGIWSDGMTMWVADSIKDKVYAYDMATGARVPGREFNTLDAAGNWTPRGIWSDGTTMWVSDWEDAKIYAYRMRKAVVFGNPNWISGQLQTEIARHMVEHGYGYATEKVPSASLPLFQGLRDGDIHLLMEVWLPYQIEYWEAALSAGDILDLGTSLGNDWQSAFVIPAYLQEQYPGLDHVEDLKQQRYRSLFSTAETGGKARLVSCPVGWSCELVNDAQIEGYGLTDYLHVIKPGDQDAMFSEIYGAYERGEPWLGYMWGTGAPALLLDLVRLEEPAYSDECWSTDRACAYEDATILIGAHSSLPALAPDVVDFLEQWDFGVDVHLRYATRWMDDNPEASIEDAALNWLTNNVDTWNAWVTKDAAAGILATLPEIPIDRAALVALYNATGGPNWTNNTNWLTNAPMAQWHGVTIDANGLVSGLDLQNNALSGEIPAELGSLTNLEQLQLDGNQLTGTIPSELARLTSLEILALGGNELTGTIPTWLGSLTKLEVLYLRGNELTGTIPSELARLTSLEILELGSNKLTGTIPSELARLTSLEILALGGNELTGTIPTWLGSLTKLVGLYLWGNELTGTIPSELARLTSLKILELGSNKLTGTIPSELARLTSLEILALGRNELTGTIPSELARLTSLKLLALGGNELTGTIPTWLGSLTKLENLYLWGNGSTGEIPSELASLTDLQRLDLSDNQLTGTIPTWLGSLTKLTELSLWGNGLSGEIPSELAGLTELQRLSLSDNQLTGTIPTWLGSLTKLTELSLWGNGLTGEIPSELASLTELQRLSLSDNQLTGTIPEWLGSLTRLTELSLWGNELTGEIPASLGLLENLTLLYLAGNQLTGCVPDGLRDVADNDFAELGLAFCPPGDPLVATYDTNLDGTIEIGELFSAIDDYFAGLIDISQLFTLIDLYFSGPPSTATAQPA